MALHHSLSHRLNGYPCSPDNSSGAKTARLFARMLSALCQEDVEVHQDHDMMGYRGDSYTVSFRRTGYRMMLTDLREMRSMGHLEVIAEDTAKRYRAEYNGKVNDDMRGIRDNMARSAPQYKNHAMDSMQYEAHINSNPKDRVKVNLPKADEPAISGADLERELQAKIDKWLNK